MLITTLLVALVQLTVWSWNPFVTFIIMGFLFAIELVCASALCYKVANLKLLLAFRNLSISEKFAIR